MANVEVASREVFGDEQLNNADLVPTPVEKRTWSWWSFATLWMGMVHSLYNFTWVGGLVLAGMSVMQALAIAIVGNLIQTLLIGLNGRVGARHGIPFAVWARATFGVYGANVPAIIRGLVAVGWFGVQSYLGATAVNLLLSASIPAWKGLDNAMLFGVSMNLWIAMILYWAINLLVIQHGMETVRRFESWAGPLIFVVMIIMVIWAVATAHGIGPVFHSPSKYHSFGRFFFGGFIPGVALYISGSWATMVLNITDITRFARSNKGQFWGTMIGLPLSTLVFYAMAGIVVSAASVIFHKVLWNPADILQAINNPFLSILGGVLLALATISVNIPANIVSPAYDFTNLLPKILNFKRAAVIAIVISFLYMPWRLMQNPSVLFGVLNNIGAVLGPATGIIIADYFLVRKQLLDVPDLYRVNGRYRATGGYNLYSLGVLVVVTVVLLLGEFIKSISWLFTYSWFIGLFVGFLGYLALVQLVKIKGSLPASMEAYGTEGRENAEVS